jgi:glycosyltransferase involved in cell wall biosynthesis
MADMGWHNGYIPEGLVPAVYAAADVVALPYIQASSSGVLLTADNFERTVAATRTGGMAELVEEGHSGILVPPNNVAELATALVYVLKHHRRNRQMAINGKQRMSRKHNWQVIARQTARIYSSILDSEKAAKRG